MEKAALLHHLYNIPHPCYRSLLREHEDIHRAWQLVPAVPPYRRLHTCRNNCYSEKIPYRIASFVGLVSIFLVGVSALVVFGPIGSGRIWLFAFSLLATLFFGLRGGIVTASLNALVLVVIGLFMTPGDLNGL